MHALLFVSAVATPALRTLFSGAEFALACEPTAVHARRAVAVAPPDLVLIDLPACGIAGLALTRWLRRRHPQVAIVMLGGTDDPIERTISLELGVDDVVGQPLDERELLARVRAVLRRTAPRAPTLPPAESANFGDCLLDLGTRRLVDARGAELALTPAEFELLVFFAGHPNEPLPRARIMAQAHGRAWDESDRSIDLRIMRLRRKLERNPDKPVLLRTVRNVGYMYVPAAGRQD